MKGILVVSFGTSHADTRKKTIEAIEKRVQEAFPTIKRYRAFTSETIISILKNRDAYQVMNVKEAFLKMKQDGIKEVYVQPTHVMHGYENDQMLLQIQAFQQDFTSIKVGEPLLDQQEDYCYMVKTIVKHYPVQKEQAVLLMGHGTSHYAGCAYAAFDYQLKEMGYEHYYMATVEGYPGLEHARKLLAKKHYKKIHLVPFMIVAGDHAKNDMAGEEEDSYRSILERDGYEVSYELKGLGELQEIQELFLNRIHKLIG